MSDETNPKGIFEKVAPVFLILTIILAFMVGVLWQKVRKLEKRTSPQVAGLPTEVPQEEIDGKLSKEKAEKIPQVTEDDHIYGNKDAEASIIVYDDFECPYCKTFHVTVKDAVEEYKGKLNLVYRQFPLDMLHTKARTEGEATECVAKLGGEEAFWEFVDKIFTVTSSNDGLDLTLLPKYAIEAGVDGGEFEFCLDNRETKEIVEAQEEAGIGAGVTGTPGVFVVNKNGDAWLIPGAVPLQVLKNTVDEALK